MSRLITFGDSFTYGHGLSDCYILKGNQEGPKPSKFAWPQVLGDMLGLEVINKSVCGYSNIQILKEILSFQDFLSSDTVIVGWTFNMRDCIFNKNMFGIESDYRVSVWHKNMKLVKDYFSVHNNHDLAVRTGLHIHHAESYLKTKTIKQFHFSAFQHEWYNKKPVFIKKPDHYISYSIIDHKLDIALDNSHPGLIAHKQAAEKLYKICQ